MKTKNQGNKQKSLAQLQTHISPHPPQKKALKQANKKANKVKREKIPKIRSTHLNTSRRHRTVVYSFASHIF